MRSKAFFSLKLLSLACAGLILGGCVTTWDYPDGAVSTKGNRYEVSLPNGWAYLPMTGSEGLIASFDGPLLESIEVLEWKLKDELPYSKITLKESMSSEELVDALYETALKDPTKAGAELEVAGPAELDGAPGFRLVFSYTNDQGLRYRVNRVGAIKGAYLYTVTFVAPVRHYYDRYDDVMDATVSSFRFK